MTQTNLVDALLQEELLQSELHRRTEWASSLPPMPAPVEVVRTDTGHAWLRLPARSLAVVGGAALVLVVGAVGVAAAATGSANPVAWGQQVEEAVTDCKAQLAEGHDIGQCVRSFASRHGAAVSAQARTQHGKGDASDQRHTTDQGAQPAGGKSRSGQPGGHASQDASGRNGGQGKR